MFLHTPFVMAALLASALIAHEPGDAAQARDQAPPASDAAGAELTAESVFHLLVGAGDEMRKLPADRLAEAESVAAQAAASAPGDWRWPLCLAAIARQKGDGSGARGHAQRAAELHPDSAVTQFWIATTIFEDISNVGGFEKFSLATKGRAAYERAVALDPSHIGARVGLGFYFLNAPGIAGGSYKKAREQGETLVALGGRAAYEGHLLLGRVAAAQKKWEDAAREMEAATKAATSKEQEAGALRTLATGLIHDKGDPDAALPIIERLRAACEQGDPAPEYMLGEARRKMNDHRAAVAHYTAAFALRPESATLHYAIAQCHEALKEHAEAIRWYEAFLAQAPDDRRADDARSAVKRLRKRLR